MNIVQLSILSVRILALWLFFKGLEPLGVFIIGVVNLVGASGAHSILLAPGLVPLITSLALFRYSEKLGRRMATVSSDASACRIEITLGFHAGLRRAISIVGLCVVVSAIPEMLSGGHQAWLRAGIREIPDALGRPHPKVVGLGVFIGLLGTLLKFGVGAWMFSRPGFFHRWVKLGISRD